MSVAWDEARKAERYGPVVCEFASRSQPNRKPYEVRCKSGANSCNCKGWVIRKTCRHVDDCRSKGITTPEMDSVELRAARAVCSLSCLTVEVVTSVLARFFREVQGAVPSAVPTGGTFKRRIVFED